MYLQRSILYCDKHLANFIYFFIIGGFFAVFIYNLLGSDCLDIIRIFLSFLVLVLVEIIYLVFVFYYVFRKKKKIVIVKIGSLINNEDLNDTIKQRGKNILDEINSSKSVLAISEIMSK